MMRTAIARSASVFQLGYALMLLGVGFLGILLARWELANVFGVKGIDALPQHGASFLAQYRFLKSIELSAGVFAVARRKAILAGKPDTVLFLLIVLAGVVARSVAWIFDGVPNTIFALFLLLEALTLVLVTWHVVARDAP